LGKLRFSNDADMMLSHKKSYLTSLLMVAAATVAMAGSDLKVAPAVRNIPERGAVTSAQLSSGAWSASVIVPTGWKVGSAKDKMVLQSQDYGAQIEVSLTSRATTEELRTQVLSRTERSRVVSDYTSAVAAGKTITIEAEHATAENLRLRTCSVFVTQEKAMVEFTLIADAQKYAKTQRVLENLIASLRKN
jgi:hypothetical protein